MLPAVTSAHVGPVAEAVPSLFSAHSVMLMAIGANCMMVVAPLRSAMAGQNSLGPKEMSDFLTPVVALFAQCFYWACYGYVMDQYEIFHFNGFGAGLCLTYMLWICSGSSMRRTAQSIVLLALGAVVGLGVCIIGSPMPTQGKAEVCACLAIVFSFVQNATPLVQAFKMLRNRSASGFPFTMAVWSCISSLLWTQYAFLVHDKMYFMSNFLNFVAAAIAILLAGVAKLSFTASWGRSDEQPLMPRSKMTADSSMLNSSKSSPWIPWTGKEASSENVHEGYGALDEQEHCLRVDIHSEEQGISSLSLVKSPFGAIQERYVEYTDEEPELEPEWDEDACDKYQIEYVPQVEAGKSSLSLDCVL